MITNVFDRISIPKPCQEDWNKMTPDQQGAFCKVCNKSVHDFSRRSAAEVEEILMKEEQGTICGRFSTEQLPAPEGLEIPLHLLPANISPFRAFALAVFIVFGTGLFGITNSSGQSIKGEVTIRKTKQASPVVCKNTTGSVVLRQPEKEAFKMGKARIDRPVKSLPAKLPDTVQLPVGEIVQTRAREVYTLGAVSVVSVCTFDTVNVIPETEKTKIDSAETVIPDKAVSEKKTEFFCYPNPGNGSATLNYEIKNRCDITAEIYDFQGRYIRQLLNTKNHYEGTYQLGINLTDLADGGYIIVMNIGALVQSTRIVIHH